MATEVSQPCSGQKRNKIEKVLQKFLEPNFKVRNDVYLNLFLSHLVGKNTSTEGKKEFNKQYGKQFGWWLIEASKLWSQPKANPPNVILSFALNLTGQLSEDEQMFVKLNSQNVYESLANVAHAKLYNDASITLGFVNLLYSFLEHKSGVQWILATTHWTDVIVLGRDAHTMYIKKKVYQLVAKLLERTICFNQSFCSNLIVQLVKPIQDAYGSLSSAESVQSTFIKNRELFESLQPSLIFLSEVMKILLESKQSDVLNVFVQLNAADLIRKLLLLSQIEDFSFELIKILCILLFSKLRKDSAAKQGALRQVAHDSIVLCDIKTLFDIIQNEMDKDHVRCVIKTCHYAHSLYCNVAGSMPLCVRKGEPIEFQNQMVLFQIIPIMTYLSQKRGVTKEVFQSDVFMREFIQKLVKISAIRSVEICFRWHERLCEKSVLIEDMTFGLQYMVKGKKLLSKEQAAIFFQPLVYSLNEFLTLAEGKQHIEMTASCVNFLHTLIETLIDIMQTFDLTWKDSIETISVMRIACDLLLYPHWEQKLVISGLRLLNLAISKSMSPDMVLLMDNSKESVVSHTGSLLYAKCHDTRWEVRDTALENVHTLSLNANSKFPSYTNILLEAKLPQLMVAMALKDAEYYVRATAFKCLQELVQIQDVWEVLMNLDKFLENILDVFENETEGVVRKEVATLVHKISKFQSFPEDMVPRVYDVMTHAAIGDLHWEVKCNALDFWFNVFEMHMINQGMIDCTFPAVTFSREQRKIVNLTELEVRKRLIKALNQLSYTGCLHVLKCACLDDCDVEVSRKAVETTSKIVDMLKMYKVPCDNIDISEPTSPSPSSSQCTSKVSDNDKLATVQEKTANFDPVVAESILDELLNSNDMSFLQQIYNPSDEFQIKNTSCQMQKRAYLAPSEYLKFIYYEAETNTVNKTQWLDKLDEFESLLDDILKEYNVEPDVNNMDCY